MTHLHISNLQGHVVSIRGRLTNIGKSGTTVIESRYAFLEGVTFPPEFKAQVMHNSPLQPGEAKETTAALYDIRKVKEAPFVGGYVEYRTAFGSTHRSYFLTMVAEYSEGTPSLVLRDHPYTDRESRKRFGWPDDT